MTTTLIYPVIGNYQVTQLFGAHSQPSSDPDDQALYLYYKKLGLKGHNGVDIATPSGTPIYAAADGTVLKAGWDTQGFGIRITIQHADNLRSLYGHLDAVCVASGDKVVRGQMIGRTGSTGYSSGPHLHWGVYDNGQAVDPLPYVEAEESTQTSAAASIPAFPALPKIKVTEDFLRVREGPGTRYACVASLDAGETVPVIGVVQEGANWWANIGRNQWTAIYYDGSYNAEWVA